MAKVICIKTKTEITEINPISLQLVASRLKEIEAILNVYGVHSACNLIHSTVNKIAAHVMADYVKQKENLKNGTNDNGKN
jgi:hypothetical protein